MTNTTIRALAAFFFSLIAISSNAYDWPVKTNEELYNDMIEYASSFANEVKDAKMSRVLKRFIRVEQRKFPKDPYAWILDTYKVSNKLKSLSEPIYDDGSDAAIVRRRILGLVDFPIHEHDRIDPQSKTPPGNEDPGHIQRDAFENGRDWYRYDALRKAVEWLNKPVPKEGELAVFRVYNMGYIFRTANRCFAIDLGREIPDKYCKALASKLDVLFLTHPHGDHFWAPMLEAMIDADKTVFLPKDVISDCVSKRKTILWEDMTIPLDVCGIKIQLFAGNQNASNPASVPNNVYHLTVDGWTINHSGDNDDRMRQSRLGELTCPDIAIFASWNNVKHSMNAIKKCPDFDKSKVTCLPSHENEFWHRVKQRESWWEDFTRNDRYADKEYDYLPCIFMDNGESILLRK